MKRQNNRGISISNCCSKHLDGQGAEVNRGTGEGFTGLHLATQDGHLDVTKYLISQGAEVNREMKTEGGLHYTLLLRMVILMSPNTSDQSRS